VADRGIDVSAWTAETLRGWGGVGYHIMSHEKKGGGGLNDPNPVTRERGNEKKAITRIDHARKEGWALAEKSPPFQKGGNSVSGLEGEGGEKQIRQLGRRSSKNVRGVRGSEKGRGKPRRWGKEKNSQRRNGMPGRPHLLGLPKKKKSPPREQTIILRRRENIARPKEQKWGGQ